MIVFTRKDQIPKARLPTHLDQYIERLLTGIMQAVPAYNPENDGHIVLVTPTDTDEKLALKLGSRYADNVFEGVSYDAAYRCFHAVFLSNNQFTVSVIVPDEPWLDPAIRERIRRETEPAGGGHAR